MGQKNEMKMQHFSIQPAMEIIQPGASRCASIGPYNETSPPRGDFLRAKTPPRLLGAVSEVQFCGQVAVDVEAEGFFQEGFGDAEIVGKIP